MNEKMTEAFTIEDFRATLFQMHPLKAIGLDGLHALFYKQCWDFVWEDMSNYLNDIWLRRLDLRDISITLLHNFALSVCAMYCIKSLLKQLLIG